ncbi:MAG: RdgB/HAM1 family non-canonical purine NTP pyrophosphatase [Methylococcales bacterium]|jgi:XTP/dITP diphosphohydrolase|nr:RdgB/HAM1 family non-canonical purine NTP pyrophosphatase [Methylococcaceae bacterium]
MALTDNQTLVLASANPGKIREIQSILTRQSIVPQSQFNIEEADETGSTFVENAIIKARNAALHSHLPALADDSGLVVDALNGAPGVISARYAGVGASDQENLQKLLTDLESVAVEKRTARFVCVMVFMRHAHDPLPIISQGVWEGVILSAPAGHHGFGYDPIFWVPSHQQTSAEMSPDIKNELSHRAQALRQLTQFISP